MANLSVHQIANLLNATTARGMAEQVGLNNQPPPISVREIMRLAGSPLQPTNLELRYSNSGHPPDDHPVPVDGIGFDWQDPSANSLRAADYWDLNVKNKSTGQYFYGGVIEDPKILTLNGLEHSTSYSWSVVPINDFGPGPSSPVYTFVTIFKAKEEPAQPAQPSPTPPNINVSSSGQGSTSQFTVTGAGFKANSSVTIRVVDDALALRTYKQSATATGELNARLSIPCTVGTLHFSATDNTPNPDKRELTGVIWSNTFHISCP